MRNLEIDSQTTLAHILNELKTTEEDGLELTVVPGEKSLLQNSVNKKIIEKVAKEYKKEVVFPAVPIEQAPETDGDDMGFVEGEDVVAKAPIEDVHKMIQTPVVSTTVNKKSPSQVNLLNKLLKKKLVWIGGVCLILIIILGVGVFLIPTADISLTAKTEDKDSQLTVLGDSTTKEVNTKDNIIPYQNAEVGKEGSDEQATTGKKTIGTVAKGRVTITNQDDTAAKTFTAGTILTPSNDASLTFKLDSDVSIEQAPTGGEKTAGVNVTAVKAGTESNLAEGTVFKVGGAPTALVFARNDVAFTGGSSKLANVASQEDRDSLKNKIIDKLEEEAKTEIEKKQQDIIVIEDSFDIKVTKEVYEPKTVDAEAEKLKATIGISATAAFVENGELKKLVIENLSAGSEGFEVDEKNLVISLQQTSKDPTGKINMIAKIKAKLVPDLNQDDIKRHLVGKSVGQAQKYLDSVEEIAAYKVSSSPFYFRILGRLPFSTGKIQISFED